MGTPMEHQWFPVKTTCPTSYQSIERVVNELIDAMDTTDRYPLDRCVFMLTYRYQ